MFTGDPFADPQSRQRFVSGDAYAHTKLLNVLASLALARRLPAEQVTVNLVHPGMAWTPMTQSMTAQTIPQFRTVWLLIRAASRGPRMADRLECQAQLSTGCTRWVHHRSGSGSASGSET
jgi:NAD(P)-dependent dehydrogenase (short-subunit alcohol dehydrogenase family)